MSLDDLVCGIDLGGTKINAALVDKEGQIRASDRTKTLASEGADGVIGRMIELTDSLCREVGIQPRALRAISVGVPGGVDDAAGVVDKAPNLGWTKVPLARRLSEALGVDRIVLDNDVRVAVLGEWAYGVGRGARTMIGIFVGTGIGGGLVLDGKLHGGARGVAGELGHMVLEPGGPRCSCGRRGCLEALASRTAIERELRARAKHGDKSKALRIMKKEDRDRLTSSVVERALEDGDELLTEVLAEAQRHLGEAVGNLINLIDPEVIVIGGGIAERLGERMVAPIREAAWKQALVQRGREGIRIEATALRDTAAPLGAAYLARERLGAA
jgi:glucokinase